MLNNAPQVYQGVLPENIQQINPPSFAQTTAQGINETSANKRFQRTMTGRLPESPAELVPGKTGYRPKIDAFKNFDLGMRGGINGVAALGGIGQIANVASGLQDIQNRGGGWVQPARPQMPVGYE
jgi:hypothetical protein